MFRQAQPSNGTQRRVLLHILQESGQPTTLPVQQALVFALKKYGIVVEKRQDKGTIGLSRKLLYTDPQSLGIPEKRANLMEGFVPIASLLAAKDRLEAARFLILQSPHSLAVELVATQTIGGSSKPGSKIIPGTYISVSLAGLPQLPAEKELSGEHVERVVTMLQLQPDFITTNLDRCTELANSLRSFAPRLLRLEILATRFPLPAGDDYRPAYFGKGGIQRQDLHPWEKENCAYQLYPYWHSNWQEMPRHAAEAVAEHLNIMLESIGNNHPSEQAKQGKIE